MLFFERIGVDQLMSETDNNNKKHLNVKNFIFFILICFFLSGGIYFGIAALSDYFSYKSARDTWNDIKDEAYDPNYVPDPDSYYNVPEDVDTDNKKSDDTKKDDPNKDMLIKIDFDFLHNKNKDVCMWIKIPDTQVDYPVMQEPVYPLSSDLSEPEYLHKDIYKNYSVAGSLFMTATCKDVENVAHRVIFGHNMQDGSMFACLSKYKDKDFYQSHQYFYIYYPDRTEKYRVCAAAHVNDESDVYKAPYRLGTSDYRSLLDYLAKVSYYDMDVTLKDNKPLLTLSTCDWTSHDDGGRIIVTGILCDTLYWTETETGGE